MTKRLKSALLGWGVIAGLLTGSGLAAETQGLPATLTLRGEWKLAPDPENKGIGEKWFATVQTQAEEAPVPGIIQQVFPAYHGVAWYWHRFAVASLPATGDRTVIRFGAVDYLGDVWINGTHVGSHEGGETPFEFDVTDLLKVGADNLLAVRVLNPTEQAIDGIKLSETPHRNKTMTMRAGSSYNFGGIIYPVQLRFLPPIYITDVFVRPELKTGRLHVTVKVNNSGAAATTGVLSLSAGPAAGGDEVGAGQKSVPLPVGVSEQELTLEIAQPRPWNLDDPFLYRVSAAVTTAEQRPHVQSVKFGFRELRVTDGWFTLNGKRIFLKSTHTGNHMPIGQQLATVPDMVRRDLINAKASGFNTVRFISGVAYPEQLDFCDELGLMVYEECYASWLLDNSPQMTERFDRSTIDMILRDRNHPSVGLWGLLNETHDGPVYQHAKGFLPTVRKFDPTRLVLLSSGRWDGEWSVGSVSNPGGSTWEPVWGDEAPGAKSVSAKQDILGYVFHSGDAHVYPPFPHPAGIDDFVRTLGRGQKPVFISEFGVGSLFDVTREHLHYEQAGVRPDLEDAAWVKRQSDALALDWKRLGFDDVYPFAEDLLRESQRLNARQRTHGFDLIRSNPQFNGYNLTGMLDHAMTGEGLWNFWREWKPGMFDAVSDGWSPLRWCLFSDAMNAYKGRPFTVEAVLANEEALKPGDYPAKFRILGPAGVVWEKSTVIKIPESNPLAVPAIRETVTINGPAGPYVFAATLEEGGAPTGGRLNFQVSDPANFPKLAGKAATWGIDDKVQRWLASKGLIVEPITGVIPADVTLILVGNPSDDAGAWETLKQRMTGGATVLFLSPKLFATQKTAMAWLPVKNAGKCYSFFDWLYHKECVARRHAVWDGLAGAGIMDPDYYGPVIPHDIFEGIDTPDDTIAAAFVTGHHSMPDGYGSSILIGAWQSGAGRFILSTPNILENLNAHPAADRLLLNLIRYGQHQ